MTTRLVNWMQYGTSCNWLHTVALLSTDELEKRTTITCCYTVRLYHRQCRVNADNADNCHGKINFASKASAPIIYVQEVGRWTAFPFPQHFPSSPFPSASTVASAAAIHSWLMQLPLCVIKYNQQNPLCLINSTSFLVFIKCCVSIINLLVPSAAHEEETCMQSIILPLMP